jgi:SOS-response transcriptional repressor LexA
MNTATTKEPQPLTTKQRHVLLYLRTFLNHNHCLPPAVCIAGAFGWRSANSAALHLKALEKKGYLRRNELGGLMLAGDAL